MPQFLEGQIDLARRLALGAAGERGRDRQGLLRERRRDLTVDVLARLRVHLGDERFQRRAARRGVAARKRLLRNPQPLLLRWRG